MDSAELIRRTEQHIRETLSHDATGHDFWHVNRVRNVALALAREMNADLLVVELAALLHDVADWKFHDGDASLGPRRASQWLLDQGAPPELATRVAEIVRDVSFKGANVATPMRTLEGKIVQDADRLDALGAIGIARAFAYGGAKGRPLHDPHSTPTLHNSFEDYKSKSNATLNHFFEKLLLLKDRMQTEAGARWAQQRHARMRDFVENFLLEWEGGDRPAVASAAQASPASR